MISKTIGTPPNLALKLQPPKRMRHDPQPEKAPLFAPKEKIQLPKGKTVTASSFATVAV